MLLFMSAQSMNHKPALTLIKAILCREHGISIDVLWPSPVQKCCSVIKWIIHYTYFRWLVDIWRLYVPWWIHSQVLAISSLGLWLERKPLLLILVGINTCQIFGSVMVLLFCRPRCLLGLKEMILVGVKLITWLLLIQLIRILYSLSIYSCILRKISW